MNGNDRILDVAIVGAGLAGIVALCFARRAGLDALVVEGKGGIGGLWRDLPDWQDIQISAADWALGDLPLHGTAQPHILANLEAWVERFALADGILLDTPVQRARFSGSAWQLDTPRGRFGARHLIAATGGHNQPLVPAIDRTGSAVTEYHSSALRDPHVLTGKKVVVVGGGASAFDLLDLCFEHRASQVTWVYRGLRWFFPTNKPKHIAGSVRGFARLQASGMSDAQQSAAIGADMRSRYEKFGINDILPDHDFDVRHDQLIPGRVGMLANFAAIKRHRDTVTSVSGHAVTLSGGESIDADLLLWGTGYGVDLSYFESPALASIRTLEALGERCASIFRSLDVPNLYFPCVGLDGIGSAPWAYSLLCRTIMSHIKRTATLGDDVFGHKVNHFEIVNYLAPRDPASYPAATWQAHYRDIALNTPDDQPYPIP